MSKTIVQKIIFKKTTPHALYELYMDAHLHSMISGGPAVITATEGSEYNVHGGYITGRNLQLVKDKLIVQSWRAKGWTRLHKVSSTMNYSMSCVRKFRKKIARLKGACYAGLLERKENIHRKKPETTRWIMKRPLPPENS